MAPDVAYQVIHDELMLDEKPTDKPNLVMGVNVRVCWEKFANDWHREP